MAEYTFSIFAPDNFSSLPSEDGTQRSSLEIGETITFLGGGEIAEITIDDPTDGVFSEVQTDQTLANPITFDGESYSAGQVATPSYIIEFSGSDGETYTVVSVQFSLNSSLEQPDAAFFLGPPPPDGTVLTVVSEENPAYGTAPPYPLPCYSPGTLIDTPGGPRAVEDLVVGDLVNTLDHGPQVIRWTGSGGQPLEEVEQDAKPVLIAAGALGRGRPRQDLIVSPQHRIFVGGGGQLDGWFKTEAFVPAKSLTALRAIRHMKGTKAIKWIHFACDRHEIVTAHGCLSESLLLGPMVVIGLAGPERRKLTAIYGTAHTPDVALNGPPARKCLKVGEVRRHLAECKKEYRRSTAKEINNWDSNLAMEPSEAKRFGVALSKSQKPNLRLVS